MSGYCEIDDVSGVLQDDFAGANPAPDEVQAAIEGQTEWLRKRTDRHWYEPAGNLTASSPESVGSEPCDIPSTPHAPAPLTFLADRPQYPQVFAGRYTRVSLAKRDVDSLSALYVRDASGAEDDWTQTKTQGRGEAFYTQTDPHTGTTYVYLHIGDLPPLYDYSNAVRVDYTYGAQGIPNSVRRGIALRAAAELVIDDDATVGIPNDGQLVALDTKASQYRSRADDLLDPYMTLNTA